MNKNNKTPIEEMYERRYNILANEILHGLYNTRSQNIFPNLYWATNVELKLERKCYFVSFCSDGRSKTLSMHTPYFTNKLPFESVQIYRVS